ncbi:MAG: hypothetical protein E7576_11295 [Ruminococcaceae bacterium]|nr:hypothetical protein [Oscillospiraceae bacterium]
MKKTLRWSVLLTLLLVCVTIPVMAQRAEAADYDVWVGGVRVTDTNLSGEGWSYDPSTKTLTLTDANISGGNISETENCGIYAKHTDLTLELVGDNTVTGNHPPLGSFQYPNDTDGKTCGILVNGTLTIQGGGNLTARTTDPSYAHEDSSGIEASDDIVINSGTVTAEGGSLTAHNHSYGLCAYEDITINGGTVEASGETRALFYAPTLPLPEGSTVKVNTEPSASFAEAWDETTPLGGSSSRYKYVKIEPGTPVTTYPLWVGGVPVTEDNKENILADTGDPTAVYDPESNTLTLTDFKTSSGYEDANIYNMTTSPLNIVLCGNNEIKQNYYGIYGKDLVISGTGTLTANSLDFYEAINAVNVEIKGGTLDLYGYENGIYATVSVTVSGDDTNVTAKADKQGITAIGANGGKITIEGGTVNAAGTYASSSYGIYTNSTVEIKASVKKVTAYGETSAIHAGNGITIEDPLEIAEPEGGMIGSDGQDITMSDRVSRVKGKNVVIEPGVVQETMTVDLTGGSAAFSDADFVKLENALSAAQTQGLISVTGALIDPENGVWASIYNLDKDSEGKFDIIQDIDNGYTALTSQSNLCGTADGNEYTVSGISGGPVGAIRFIFPAKTYIITWQDDEGNIIDATEVKYDTVPTHAAPTKANTAEYTYTFAGWTPAPVAATEDATYKATYTATKNKYTVTWVIDGTSETEQYEYGAMPTHADPTKPADAQYTYTFAGWTPAIVSVTGNATYTAVFTNTVNQYTVTWIIDGVSETEVYDYGATPSHADPTKPADAQYTYTFAGWTPAIVSVTGNATYTATYTESSGGGSGTGTTYTVTWRNYNGAVLETDTNVPYGSLPAYNGTTPYRPSTSAYIYAFSGWTPALAPVTGDVTYTAYFTSAPNFGPGGSVTPGIPGGTIPGIPGLPGLPGVPGIPGFTPAGTPGSTPGTDPGSTPGGETGLPFMDVSPDSPFYDDIAYVYENDIMIGMSDTEFGENLPLTRGMIVTVLHRMEGKPEVTYSGVFTDVPAGEWYTDGVEWAASHGIVLGYGNGKYGPTDPVTREQLAAILFRYANWKGYDTSVGEDTNILSYDDAFTWGDWAVPALQWACGTGVLEDVPVGMLRPTEPAIRGEIAHAIRVFCEEVAK